MKQTYFLILLLLLTTYSCKTQVKTMPSNTQPLVNYQHPIPFQPEQYVCYKTNQPIVVDGKLSENDWAIAPSTSNFVDIEGELKPNPSLRTYAKMLWDNDYFYIAAYLEEPHIWATLTERDAIIFQDDNFEVFIDPEGDGHNYYEFEVNAFNTVWDLILLKPYRIDNSPKVLNNWEIKGLQSAVHIEGTLNEPADSDKYWTVEIAFPWSVLKELSASATPPKNGDQWRVNFSRVDWTMEVNDGKYQKKLRPNSIKPLAADNWVWSPQGRIAMHHPETWGYVQFTNQQVGKKAVDFTRNPAEVIKWGLWQLHFQQVAYHKKYQKYATQLSELTPVDVSIPNHQFRPKLENYTGGYQILASSTDGQQQWIINQDGKIWNE